MEWLQVIFWGIVKVLAVFILTYAGLMFTKYLENLQDKIGKDRYEAVMKIVRDIVKAMEQLYGSGQGKKKKEEAMKYLTTYLHLSEEEADKLIEAAVWELNHLIAPKD